MQEAPPTWSQSGPPRLRLATAAGDLNPSSPAYDPLRLVRESKVRVRSIFWAEPRDAVWADAMEQGLRAPLTADLQSALPGLSDLTIECRTTVCRFTWNANGGRDLRARHVIRYLYGGAAIGVAKPNEMYVTYAGGKAFSELKGRPREMLARLAADRSDRLPRLRAGEFPAEAYQAIPASEWPPL
jgi:hypothetical protein